MQPRSHDYKDYKTVRSPELFKVSWEPFYRESLARTDALLSRYRHELDVPYGSSIFQTLDVYLPETVNAETPCFVFLHGGAFREGHPRQYGFVGKPYLERGIAFISAGYRLAPEAFYPDHVQDVAALSSWLHARLPKYGLDSRRLVMSGHSSGALMIALAAVRTDWQKTAGVPEGILDTVVLAGANYDHRPEFAENLVRDLARREEGTVICNLQRVPRRAIIVFGVDEQNTGDGRRFERSGRPLGAALEERGTAVEIFALDAHHQGTCEALCQEGPVLQSVVAALRDTSKRT
ncbi:alpha/beta hydrolase [Rhodoplanes sp. Z2-YC6860]|uniref:alpha/beta hydrolase n=1 Tax=Rhodoplanes sp. Z2-YC6860 TaxID=674703 RepID=UPI00078CE6B4|nr:alpha/beta hydrolase [Rhodoplanes sp. Z2-YC6860]AMN44383.1 esterase E-1 [Rhodoplanes sp. Z2-YC6860]